MVWDCSAAYNQLARWNQIKEQWNDSTSAKMEVQYMEPLQIQINRLTEKLYEIHDFMAAMDRRFEE